MWKTSGTGVWNKGSPSTRATCAARKTVSLLDRQCAAMSVRSVVQCACHVRLFTVSCMRLAVCSFAREATTRFVQLEDLLSKVCY
eukprot:3717867-Pleurochrysis_carterae.AAC.3